MLGDEAASTLLDLDQTTLSQLSHSTANRVAIDPKSFRQLWLRRQTLTSPKQPGFNFLGKHLLDLVPQRDTDVPLQHSNSAPYIFDNDYKMVI